MTPHLFTGAWRRTSIAVDGGQPVVSAEVRWVQAGDHYADLRIPDAPGEPPECFAGTTTWEDPHLRWAHELDLGPTGGADDVGEITEDGDDLVETGSFERDGRTATYVERWQRLAGSDGAALALVRADGPGHVVVAGDHALAVSDDRTDGGRFLACAWRRHQGSWRVDLRLDDPPLDDLTPDDLTPDDLTLDGRCLEEGASVELGGRRWRMAHARPEPTPATR